jgi:hypothetical protein
MNRNTGISSRKSPEDESRERERHAPRDGRDPMREDRSRDVAGAGPAPDGAGDRDPAEGARDADEFDRSRTDDARRSSGTRDSGASRPDKTNR